MFVLVIAQKESWHFELNDFGENIESLLEFLGEKKKGKKGRRKGKEERGKKKEERRKGERREEERGRRKGERRKGKGEREG